MSWTKRQFIEEAFNEIGLASYTYDLTPSELQSALRKMDAMIATWNGKGIRIPYPLPNSPSDSDIDSLTTVPDSANEAIYKNLACRLAPSFGKIISSDTKKDAEESYKVLLNRSIQDREMQLPDTTPLGEGNKPWRGFRGPFVRKPKDYLQTGQDGIFEFN